MNDFYGKKAQKYKYKYLKLKELEGGDQKTKAQNYWNEMYSCLSEKRIDKKIILPIVSIRDEQAEFTSIGAQPITYYSSQSPSLTSSQFANSHTSVTIPPSTIIGSIRGSITGSPSQIASQGALPISPSMYQQLQPVSPNPLYSSQQIALSPSVTIPRNVQFANRHRSVTIPLSTPPSTIIGSITGSKTGSQRGSQRGSKIIRPLLPDPESAIQAAIQAQLQLNDQISQKHYKDQALRYIEDKNQIEILRNTPQIYLPITVRNQLALQLRPQSPQSPAPLAYKTHTEKLIEQGEIIQQQEAAQQLPEPPPRTSSRSTLLAPLPSLPSSPSLAPLPNARSHNIHGSFSSYNGLTNSNQSWV